MKSTKQYRIFFGVIAYVALFTTGLKNRTPTWPVAKEVTLRQTHLRPVKIRKSYLLYPFIRQDKNVIVRKGSEPLKHFYSSLDSLSNGFIRKVNVVHIGDSHIQADVFPGKLREGFHMDSALGNGGRGFTFPYSAIRTNAPVNLKVNYEGVWTGCRNIERSRSCEWGLAGMTATTYQESASFAIDPNTYAPVGLHYPVTRVRVFYDVRDPSMFGISLLNEEVVISRHIDQRGFVEFRLQQPVNKVIVGFERKTAGQNHFTLQGISLENDQPGVQYHSVGVNGAEVTSYLRSPLFESNLAALQADLVIVSLGTNDAYMMQFDAEGFKRNYGTLVQRIHRAAPHASILLTTPGDCYRKRKYVNYNNARAGKEIFELAEETGSAVWDFYAVMGGIKSVQKWYASGLAAADKIHLTRKGYALQGNLLFDALMNDYYTFSGAQKVRITTFDSETKKAAGAEN